MKTIKPERLRELVDYDPDSGLFRNKSGRVIGGNQKCGKTAYLVLWVDDGPVLAHRAAWAYMTGAWPSNLIDHINNIGTDNRWANLRASDRSQNGQNAGLSRRNKVGLKGVSPTRNGTFRAVIRPHGKQICLGTYKTPEEAHRKYVEAAKRLYGEFARAA